jgi:uncharacterized protein YkwD
MTIRNCRTAAAAGFVLLGLGCAAAGTSLPGTSPTTGRPVAENEVASQVVSLTNLERSRAGLAPLREDEQLMRAAQIHAEQMASARLMAHDIPGARYPTLQSRLAGVGYTYRSSGENISWNQPTARAALTSWMRSPAHRSNMLSTTFTEMGAGYATDASGQAYYVQVFGLPR